MSWSRHSKQAWPEKRRQSAQGRPQTTNDAKERCEPGPDRAGTNTAAEAWQRIDSCHIKCIMRNQEANSLQVKADWTASEKGSIEWQEMNMGDK